MPLQFDLSITPLSREGSYLSLSRPRNLPPEKQGLYLRTHHATRVGRCELFALTLLDANGQPFTGQVHDHAHQTHATIDAGSDRTIDLCLTAPDSWRITGRGNLGLRLRMEPGPGVVAQPLGKTPTGQPRILVNARQSFCQCMVDTIRGRVELDAPWGPNRCERIVVDLLPDEHGCFDVALDVFQSTWTPRDPRPGLDDARHQLAQTFDQYLDKLPPADEQFALAREHAGYVMWSATVPPGGLFTRPAVLMSKMWMDQVWSWDHCFNAMALSHGHPWRAVDQFMLMIEQQDEFGAFPDAVNPAIRHFNHCKPPVHGWALRYCMEHGRGPLLSANVQRLLYDGLARWSRWWLDHRTLEGEQLPCYLHGNDSGWDNATIFDHGAPLIGPDLAAFLAVQCDVLAQMASRLGLQSEAAIWQTQSQRLREQLISQLWREDLGHFIGKRQHDGFEVICDSLVTCMPIVLGDALPREIQQKLVQRIKRFVTDHGLATEHPDSPHYKPNGYWRGPIWAPSTMLIIDGLTRVGQMDLARDIAMRFCRTCAREGFAENFDALSGASLRDPAYTWTASVFLVLAHQFR